MDKSRPLDGGHILAAALGALAGGVTVAIATKAVPRVLSQMMSCAMQNTMTRMGGESCDPEEM